MAKAAKPTPASSSGHPFSVNGTPGAHHDSSPAAVSPKFVSSAAAGASLASRRPSSGSGIR